MYDKRLDTFLEVCNTQSFNTASERLYISPSAIKKQIDLLERELGFKLFKRTKKGVSLTLSGQSFYKDTLKLIKLSNDAQRRSFLIAQKERYTIKVGSSLLFSSNDANNRQLKFLSCLNCSFIFFLRLRYKRKNPKNRIFQAFSGGRGWIRTTEVADDRFTVCSLWPLGNPSFLFSDQMELVTGIEPATC